jgi:hypothetical protein
MKKFTAIVILLIMTALHGSPQTRPRARELGITVGILPTGTLNAITDVDGVLVGHTTIVRGDNIRTGVTAILPHGGNLFREKVPGAVFVGNGFGKLAGSTQVNELGEIETPILLTSTLSVPRVADFLLDFGFKGGIGTSSRKLPQKARRIHGGRPGPIQLRRRFNDQRRSDRPGIRALFFKGRTRRTAGDAGRLSNHRDSN